ncbi:MAG TPA: Hsp20/alpha crystallin family protein [Steroidobacteraceae bacterium]|nr:Hsp20/alpha crystallin family protein [Steroidobacteraceae bacterium]
MARNDMTTTERRGVAEEASRMEAAERDRIAVQPAVDILEDAQGITLHADLPGVNIEGLDVRVEGDTLFLSGTSNLALPQGAQPVYAEQRSLVFRRRFSLSGDLDASGIEAQLTNGVLKVRIPKTPAAQPRRIEVRPG